MQRLGSTSSSCLCTPRCSKGNIRAALLLGHPAVAARACIFRRLSAQWPSQRAARNELKDHAIAEVCSDCAELANEICSAVYLFNNYIMSGIATTAHDVVTIFLLNSLRDRQWLRQSAAFGEDQHAHGALLPRRHLSFVRRNQRCGNDDCHVGADDDLILRADSCSDDSTAHDLSEHDPLSTLLFTFANAIVVHSITMVLVKMMTRFAQGFLEDDPAPIEVIYHLLLGRAPW
jgi:hypothetical protein